jgi:hypothetical protein
VTGGTLGGGAVAAMVFGAHLFPPLMLLGLPVIGAGVLLSRSIYRGIQSRTQDRLESFLDRVEHNELKLDRPVSPLAEWRKRLGI